MQPRAPTKRLSVEQLEDRTTPDGTPWFDGTSVSLSFVPDGTKAPKVWLPDGSTRLRPARNDSSWEGVGGGSTHALPHSRTDALRCYCPTRLSRSSPGMSW